MTSSWSGSATSGGGSCCSPRQPARRCAGRSTGSRRRPSRPGSGGWWTSTRPRPCRPRAGTNALPPPTHPARACYPVPEAPRGTMRDQLLAEHLIREGLLRAETHRQALEHQLIVGGRLDTVLLDLDLVGESQVLDAVCAIANAQPAGVAELDAVDPLTARFDLPPHGGEARAGPAPARRQPARDRDPHPRRPAGRGRARPPHRLPGHRPRRARGPPLRGAGPPLPGPALADPDPGLPPPARRGGQVAAHPAGRRRHLAPGAPRPPRRRGRPDGRRERARRPRRARAVARGPGAFSVARRARSRRRQRHRPTATAASTPARPHGRAAAPRPPPRRSPLPRPLPPSPRRRRPRPPPKSV